MAKFDRNRPPERRDFNPGDSLLQQSWQILNKCEFICVLLNTRDTKEMSTLVKKTESN